MFWFNIAAVSNVMKIRNDMLEVCLFSKSFDNIPSKIDILLDQELNFLFTFQDHEYTASKKAWCAGCPCLHN